MQKNSTDDIQIFKSRLAGFIGSLFPGLIAFMLLDSKFGKQMFEINALSPAWYWGAVILSSIAFILLVKQSLFPKTVLIVNRRGIEVGLGDYKSGTQFIPWGKIQSITKAEIRDLGRYSYNSTTKKSEPRMIPGVEIELSEKIKQCGPRLAAFVEGNSIFITETRSDRETFINSLHKIKELAEK